MAAIRPRTDPQPVACRRPPGGNAAHGSRARRGSDFGRLCRARARRRAAVALGGRCRACHSRGRRHAWRRGLMLLAVDMGNTNVVFALFEEGEIRARWRIATDPRRTGDEYAVWLSQLMAIEG